MSKQGSSEVEAVVYYPHEATPEIVEPTCGLIRIFHRKLLRLFPTLPVAYKQFSTPGTKK